MHTHTFFVEPNLRCSNEKDFNSFRFDNINHCTFSYNKGLFHRGYSQPYEIKLDKNFIPNHRS